MNFTILYFKLNHIIHMKKIKIKIGCVVLELIVRKPVVRLIFIFIDLAIQRYNLLIDCIF